MPESSQNLLRRHLSPPGSGRHAPWVWNEAKLGEVDPGASDWSSADPTFSSENHSDSRGVSNRAQFVRPMGMSFMDSDLCDCARRYRDSRVRLHWGGASATDRSPCCRGSKRTPARWTFASPWVRDGSFVLGSQAFRSSAQWGPIVIDGNRRWLVALFDGNAWVHIRGVPGAVVTRIGLGKKAGVAPHARVTGCAMGVVEIEILTRRWRGGGHP
jgi:hypothetical protein